MQEVSVNRIFKNPRENDNISQGSLFKNKIKKSTITDSSYIVPSSVKRTLNLYEDTEKYIDCLRKTKDPEVPECTVIGIKNGLEHLNNDLVLVSKVIDKNQNFGKNITNVTNNILIDGYVKKNYTSGELDNYSFFCTSTTVTSDDFNKGGHDNLPSPTKQRTNNELEKNNKYIRNISSTSRISVCDVEETPKAVSFKTNELLKITNGKNDLQEDEDDSQYMNSSTYEQDAPNYTTSLNDDLDFYQTTSSELYDNDGSNDSEYSNFSGMSNLSGQEWKPITRPIYWIQKQMQNGADPREILSHIYSGRIAPELEDIALWRILANILAEPPRREKLESFNTLQDVISLLRNSKNIIVLTGAGVSVSCGIPDFRSNDGIYSRLAKDFPDLPDPQAMFDINYFSRDPRPFFRFAREIYPGQFKPSPCHRFIKLLERKNKLLRNYSQNIDTLERVAGICNVIECHGSFATASCTKCKFKQTADVIRDEVLAQRIPLCPKCQLNRIIDDDTITNQSTISACKSFPADISFNTCSTETDVQKYTNLVENGIMKPDIVFFGEGLPNEFHSAIACDKQKCDLLIVIGSSLKVRPVALIPNSIPSHVPQILINRERLHHLEFDVQLLGDSDVIINQLCHLLGGDYSEICCNDQILIETELLKPPSNFFTITPQTQLVPHSSLKSRTNTTYELAKSLIPTSLKSSSDGNCSSYCYSGFESSSLAHTTIAEDSLIKNNTVIKDILKTDPPKTKIEEQATYQQFRKINTSYLLLNGKNATFPSTDEANVEYKKKNMLPNIQNQISKKLIETRPEQNNVVVLPKKQIVSVTHDTIQSLRLMGNEEVSGDSENHVPVKYLQKIGADLAKNLTPKDFVNYDDNVHEPDDKNNDDDSDVHNIDNDNDNATDDNDHDDGDETVCVKDYKNAKNRSRTYAIPWLAESPHDVYSSIGERLLPNTYFHHSETSAYVFQGAQVYIIADNNVSNLKVEIDKHKFNIGHDQTKHKKISETTSKASVELISFIAKKIDVSSLAGNYKRQHISNEIDELPSKYLKLLD